MKRSIVVTVLIVALGLFIAGGAYAWWGGYGMGYGAGANVENVKKFQKETLSVRDELLTTQLELQNEYNKPAPDTTRIATLKKEVIDIQAKIQTVAEKYGLPAFGTGHGMGHGMRHGMTGRGMMGQGHGTCACPMCGS